MAANISRILLVNLIKFAVWPTLPGGQLNAKMVCFEEGTMEIYEGMKIILSFYQYIHNVTQCMAFLATRHTTVCLDMEKQSC